MFLYHSHTKSHSEKPWSLIKSQPLTSSHTVVLMGPLSHNLGHSLGCHPCLTKETLDISNLINTLTVSNGLNDSGKIQGKYFFP